MLDVLQLHCCISYGGPVGRGCHDVHIRDLWTCTHAHLGFADLHIRDLRMCTHAICGRAHTRFAEVQLFPRGCHVATTWQTRCNHVATTWKQLYFRKVRKSQMCMCARHDNCDLPGHHNFLFFSSSAEESTAAVFRCNNNNDNDMHCMSLPYKESRSVTVPVFIIILCCCTSQETVM